MARGLAQLGDYVSASRNVGMLLSAKFRAMDFAGENVEDYARASEVVWELLRFKLKEQRVRLQESSRGH